MKFLSWIALTLVICLSGTEITYAAVQLQGAGATFPYTLYSKWASEYNKVNPNVQINYQSVGSGTGINQIIKKTVDFGATDAPMNEEQLGQAKATGGDILHIPTVLGAVVVTYNLPEAPKGLKLTGDVVADIFLGKITKWNDPKITKNNPTFKFDGDILVVRRSDGSGTTSIFTDYLSKVSPDFKTKVGQGTSVNWPVGIGGKGNEGVTGAVKQTPGSIGYVELIYAENNKLPYATIKNQVGSFVAPNLKSVTSAAQGALKNMPADFRVSITNPAGTESYPIAGFTYLLVYKAQTDAVKGPELVKFLEWAMKDGQGFAEGLLFSPLPKELVKKVEAKIKSIEVQKVN